MIVYYDKPLTKPPESSGLKFSKDMDVVSSLRAH